MMACHDTPEHALSLAGIAKVLACLYMLSRASGEVPVLAVQHMDDVLDRFGTYGRQWRRGGGRSPPSVELGRSS